MSVTRQNIKTAIANALQNIPNVKGVFTARQRITQSQQTPVLTVYLPDVTEEKLGFDKRRLHVTALVEVIMLDVNPKPETGEAIFDGILDAIDTNLRGNLTLGGVVDGSAIKNLETHISAPQMVEGNTIFRVGVKKFDVTVTINA